MNISIELVLFCAFAILSWASALGVVCSKDPVKSALNLVGCFFCIACLYLLQAAELMAVLEVLVYAGAIMVLFVFVIMLVEQRNENILPESTLSQIGFFVKIAAVLLVTLNFCVVILRNSFTGTAAVLPVGFGGPQATGQLFFSNYVFHFELASVLLVVAIVGAVVISQNKSSETKESTAS